MFAVFRTLLLNSVIGQVHHFVAEVPYGVLLAGGAHIPLLVPVALQLAIHTGHQQEAADVKLAFLVQQRVFYIFLENEGLLLPIVMQPVAPHVVFYLLDTLHDAYPQPRLEFSPGLMIHRFMRLVLRLGLLTSCPETLVCSRPGTWCIPRLWRTL